MLEALSDKLSGVFQKLGSHGSITEKDLDEAMREVRIALLEADVNFKVVRQFVAAVRERALGAEDRKSTRLNSSHLVISYAVFCLKKKKLTNTCQQTYTNQSSSYFFRLDTSLHPSIRQTSRLSSTRRFDNNSYHRCILLSIFRTLH